MTARARGRLYEFLSRDHARLDELLGRIDAAPELDREAYRGFRGGLLRHIAMEEKVLLPEAQRIRGAPLPVARLLRADHAALAALLVPSPTHALVAKLREVLAAHNPLEEDPGGLYEVCEALAGAEADTILARVEAIPEVPMRQNIDGPRVFEHIDALLRARDAIRAEGVTSME